MRSWRRTWAISAALTLGVALVATSGLVQRGASAQAQPAAVNRTDLAVTGLETVLGRGEALALQALVHVGPQACRDGFEAGAEARANGATEQRLRYYYDTGCRTRARTVVIRSTGQGTVVSATSFGRGGNQISTRITDYRSSIVAGARTLRAVSRVSSGANDSLVALANASWDELKDGTVAASLARVGDPQSSAFGVSEQSTETVSRDPRGAFRTVGQLGGPVFHGQSGSLAITLDAPYDIMGSAASRVGAASARWDGAVDASGLPTELDVYDGTLSDELHVSLSTHSGSSSSFVGAVADGNGNAVARVIVDRFGNGDARFADGSSVSIADWHLVATGA